MRFIAILGDILNNVVSRIMSTSNVEYFSFVSNDPSQSNTWNTHFYARSLSRLLMVT